MKRRKCSECRSTNPCPECRVIIDAADALAELDTSVPDSPGTKEDKA